ncbi:MAG: hypothetical protein COX80_05185 [Candidatus Magasanikbacteria bacterium CG_4_10_14_0_2_um_filter_33_14]|uniref:VOC domain-containing protein n=1 Tax=Candidatus Magasanikbacteria bacterium CG_4_10_14_0_2_um_filter_33_14 TaxID=1974636 RepID=A0A2M7V8F4_9BACT|nr:MAG: hypothetical protein COX80_05185 [Candidatus Magasanikbacteria bacterium CG_4_10_14_0_2_um_filter_33_14]
MSNLKELLGDVSPFLERLFLLLKKDHIDVSNYELDHVCYRVETMKRYKELKKKLKRYGDLLSETEIGGRPISTFKLYKPLQFANRNIYCIELPAPKDNSFYKEGYEHAEFVIDLSFQDFMNLYRRVNFETKALSKPINPDISIKYDGLSVKFHQHSLEYVINYLE